MHAACDQYSKVVLDVPQYASSMRGARDGAVPCIGNEFVRARQHRDRVELHATQLAKCGGRAAAPPRAEEPLGVERNPSGLPGRHDRRRGGHDGST